MTRLIRAGLLLLGLLLLSSQSSIPAEGENQTAELEYGVWDIPAEAVSTSEPSVPRSKRKPKPGFVASESSDHWDASEFIKSLGAAEVPGLEAKYDAANSILVVKTTKKNIEIIGITLSLSGLEKSPTHFVSELSVFECSSSPKSEAGFVVWPSYTELIEKTPKDARVIDYISGTARSGKRSQFIRRVLSGEKNTKPQSDATTAEKNSLGKNELGIEAELESVMADTHHIDTSLAFRWRGKLQDQATASIAFTTSFTSQENLPIVIHVSSQEKAPGKYLVVTANIRLESSVDWSLESLSKIGNKAREILRARKVGSQPPEKDAP